MITSRLLALSLLASPLVFVGCKNDGADTQVQSQGNAEKLKDAETQVQSLRADNDKLRQENETLRANLTKVEGRLAARPGNTNSGRSSSRGDMRNAPPSDSETPAANAPQTITPRDKQALRQGVTGGDSFK